MLLIRNGYMIDPKSGKEGYYDILTEGKRIRCIKESISDLPEGVEMIDARGWIVAPGLVDVHVHFREPGFTYKEDILTGAAAAAKGGFTSVIMMANTKPSIDNRLTLAEVLEKGRRAGIHVLSCANVTLGMRGEELVPMEELAAAGAAGFTDDGVPVLKEELVREAMKRAAELDLPISFHEEDPQYIENNGINRGRASEYFKIGGSPREAEISMVRRDIGLAKETSAHIDIQHISTKEAVELVREARREGYTNIHAEATPHHFTLTEEAAIQYGTLAKMNPPLREEADRQAIIKGLAEGVIEMIATDHAPHSREEKERSITQAPSGIIGLETSLSLGITELVQKGHLTMRELLNRMSTGPAELYHLNAGYLAEDGPADLVLIDRDAEMIPGDYVSKAENSPFTGWRLQGRVMATVCDGEIVYRAPGRNQ